VPDLPQRIITWYAANARDLPWRVPGVGAWQVLVSEVMLQQTPVARVLPVYESWTRRWPTPGTLAAESPGEAVRAWGRLGYPRRALRLHESSRLITERHAGQVPVELDALRALPGVGEYTAAAVASFAHRQRHVVLDTNVRRLLARLIHGRAQAPPTLTVPERHAARGLLPHDAATAARWSVAAMELGALVCRPDPACHACPVADRCSWRAAGYPQVGSVRRKPSYVGSDRQCRGRVLGALRDASGAVSRGALEKVWPDREQLYRALAGLAADGLLEVGADDRYRLPGHSVAAGSTGGMSGSCAFGVPLNVKEALGPSPSTSTSTI